MQWHQIETFEEFKRLGSYRNLRQEIKNSLGEKLYFKAKGWSDLWEVVQSIRKLSEESPKKVQEFKITNTSDEKLMYFKSEADRIIYALLRLDGEQRLRELGVDKSYIKDVEKAKNWRNTLAKIIHPDVCKHPEAAEASTKLTKLYEQMTRK